MNDDDSTAARDQEAARLREWHRANLPGMDTVPIGRSALERFLATNPTQHELHVWFDELIAEHSRQSAAARRLLDE